MISSLPGSWRIQAGRNLPRYTSYPTALAFQPAAPEAFDWVGRTRADEAISAYVHIPFCKRLCWYCGCHTSIAHDYERTGAYEARLRREVELWAEALGPHAGLAHLHFGGGSPNALTPEDFLRLTRLICERLDLRPGAEIAAELDPGLLSIRFIDAAAEAGVTRISLGVQTLDPQVQRKVNRVQPFDQVARAVEHIRAVGVAGLNFDLMYGLPGQTPRNVRDSVAQALTLRPDRVAVFGYAHVPWMKKHQTMIQEGELAGIDGRWEQAEAADEALRAAGYVQIGLDHYALPNDALSCAAAEGRLRRNFQGYTDDPAPVLVPLGASSIGRFAEGFVQNGVATDVWGRAVDEGRLPIARQLPVTREDELRAAVIERLMCDLSVDVAALCRVQGFAEDQLDDALALAKPLQDAGLAVLETRTLRIPPAARRLMRAVAACFDANLPTAPRTHAKAV
jgi:oxygen-independent coproporphyrinogen-3 oxidase